VVQGLLGRERPQAAGNGGQEHGLERPQSEAATWGQKGTSVSRIQRLARKRQPDLSLVIRKMEQHKDRLRLVLPCKRQDPFWHARFVPQGQRSTVQRRKGAPKGKQSLVVLEQRGGVFALGLDVAERKTGVYRQKGPGARRRKTGVFVHRPLHGGATFVSVQQNPFLSEQPAQFRGDKAVHVGKGVERAVSREVEVRHPDLLALVDKGDAARTQLERGQDLCAPCVVAQPFDVPGLVVVAEHPGRQQRSGKFALVFFDEVKKRLGGKRRAQRFEQKDQIQTIIGHSQIRTEELGRAKDLADQKPLLSGPGKGAIRLSGFGDGIDKGTQGAGKRDAVLVVDGVEVLLEKAVRVFFRGERTERKGVVRETGVLQQRVKNIEAQTVGPLFQKEPDDGQHVPRDRRIPMVQVGLERQKTGEVVVAACGVALPTRGTNHGSPVVRGFVAARSFPFAEQIVVALGAFGAKEGLLKPRMLVGRVVQDQIEHQPHATPRKLLPKLHQIRKGARLCADLAVVAHVVPQVASGAVEKGGEPQRFNAQLGEHIQFGEDAAQIADSVSVCVAKRTGIDLIHGRLLPPGEGTRRRVGRGRRSRHGAAPCGAFCGGLAGFFPADFCPLAFWGTGGGLMG